MTQETPRPKMCLKGWENTAAIEIERCIDHLLIEHVFSMVLLVYQKISNYTWKIHQLQLMFPRKPPCTVDFLNGTSIYGWFSNETLHSFAVDVISTKLYRALFEITAFINWASRRITSAGVSTCIVLDLSTSIAKISLDSLPILDALEKSLLVSRYWSIHCKR